VDMKLSTIYLDSSLIDPKDLSDDVFRIFTSIFRFL